MKNYLFFMADLPIRAQMGHQDVASVYFQFLTLLHGRILVVLAYLLILITFIMHAIVYDIFVIKRLKPFKELKHLEFTFRYKTKQGFEELEFNFAELVRDIERNKLFKYLRKLIKLEKANKPAFILVINSLVRVKLLGEESKLFKRASELLLDDTIKGSYIDLKVSLFKDFVLERVEIANNKIDFFDTKVATILKTPKGFFSSKFIFQSCVCIKHLPRRIKISYKLRFAKGYTGYNF